MQKGEKQSKSQLGVLQDQNEKLREDLAKITEKAMTAEIANKALQ